MQNSVQIAKFIY